MKTETSPPSKKILIVTTSFAPENAIGAVRLTKIVKYLVRKGHDITVLSPEITEDMKVDETLNSQEISFVKRIYVNHSKLFKKIFLSRRNKLLKKESAANLMSSTNKKGITKEIKAYIFTLLHFSYTIIRNFDWKRNAIKAFFKSNPHDKFDVIISSYPSLGAMWAAKVLRKRNVAPIWIADFRDPINYQNNNRLLYKINTALQKSIIKYSHHTSIISNGIRDKFPPNSRLKVIYNGFDINDLPNLEENGNKKITLCYTGSLQGGKRDLQPFLISLNQLILEEKILPQNIEINYAGKDFNILLNQAKDKIPLEILVNHGFTSRSYSIEIQNNSDLVLVATWNTKDDQGVLTGKLFECFLTRKPVIGLVSGDVPNSEFKEIIMHVNGGYVYEEADPATVEGLKKYILEKYNEKIEHGYTKNNYNEKINTFSYENIADQFELLINSKPEH